VQFFEKKDKINYICQLIEDKSSSKLTIMNFQNQPTIKMRRTILTLLICLWASFQTFAQAPTTNYRGPCGTDIQHGIILNRFIFYPNSIESNKPESSINFCNYSKNVFFLNGLELSEAIFIELNLKQKKSDSATYSYRYIINDTTNCVECVDFFINIKTPFILNGLELEEAKKEFILRQIKPEQLVSIIYKRSFYRESVIEIITKGSRDF